MLNVLLNDLLADQKVCSDRIQSAALVWRSNVSWQRLVDTVDQN